MIQTPVESFSAGLLLWWAIWRLLFGVFPEQSSSRWSRSVNQSWGVFSTHQKPQYHCLTLVKRKGCISWRCWPLSLSSAGFLLWLHIRRDLKRLRYLAWPSLLSVVSMAAWKGGEWVADLNQCVYAGLILTLRKTARMDMQGSRLQPFFENVRVKIWRGRTCASAWSALLQSVCFIQRALQSRGTL